MSCCSSYWTGQVTEPTLFIPNLPSSIKEIDLRNAFSGLSVSLISIQQKYIAGN
ncbi:hypothetical protein BDQ12DRAFT_689417 [Crucibulum laeve]|uniref:RRM domain-containing protein n=1 Tax=Crucibulum laeve TaxID=68775 RepID=A0A5C3LQV5_9AGAR|nr:hypothetical protein BDQ12DRAFT_689417 [Crucibulum laeve]